MFTTLYFKEWREKALLFFFELGILVLLFAAQSVFREKRDIQEWLVYAMLLLFFPFAALILGAAGFEAEYRQGAWAYLFSRPVRRPVIWLAKFAALLSMLAALWLVFLALWASLPGTREFVVGARILLGFTVQSGFPWWSLWQSVFLLTVAFSLSLLHERQFNILFLSFIAGLGLTVAAWVVLISKAGGFLAMLAPSRALATLLVSQVLIALAFAAASVLTLARSDFSQPRKQISSFVRWAVPFLILAVAGTAAWALLAPASGEHYLYLSDIAGGEPYYYTPRGVFKYSASANRIQWLAKTKNLDYFRVSAAGGKLAYTAFDIRSRYDIAEELWVADTGGGRQRIIGRGPKENEWPQEAPIADLMMSPDASKVAILSANVYGQHRLPRRPPLWIAETNGTGLENLPDDPALFGEGAERYYYFLVAWVLDEKALLIERRTFHRPMTYSLWLYDLGTRAAKILLDNAVRASWQPAGGDRLAIKYQKGPEGPWTLAILDLASLKTTDVAAGEDSGLFRMSWDPKGERMAYLVRKPQQSGLYTYALVLYSLAAGKIVAEKVMTASEAEAIMSFPAWTADGAAILLLDPGSRSLIFLGPDLRETGRIPLPAWITSPGSLQVVGRQALIDDDTTNSLWRLDLAKKSWKKLY
jgi:ABC-type transport system involved in multi-copper enzyme maturation permease subunit